MKSFILVHERTESEFFIPSPVPVAKIRQIIPLTNKLTRIVLDTGREYLVKETPDEIVRQIEFRQRA